MLISCKLNVSMQNGIMELEKVGLLLFFHHMVSGQFNLKCYLDTAVVYWASLSYVSHNKTIATVIYQ